MKYLWIFPRRYFQIEGFKENTKGIYRNLGSDISELGKI